MIRSEYDFLQNLLGVIGIGRQSKAEPGYILGKVEEMIRNRLVIYSGQAEPYWNVTMKYSEPNLNFQPIKVEGKPLSEMIIEDRG